MISRSRLLMRGGEAFAIWQQEKDVNILTHVSAFVNGSPRDLGHRLPGAGRDVLAERLLDERHEDGSLRVGEIGAENLQAVHDEDARAIHLDRQFELRLWLLAQEGDDAL